MTSVLIDAVAVVVLFGLGWVVAIPFRQRRA
jgi:hypothetical protein